MKDLYVYNVTGSGPFPIDMLRYDQAWPKSEGRDSAAIESSFLPRQGARVREITLGSHTTPTEVRWKSFGWTVDKVSRTRQV